MSTPLDCHPSLRVLVVDDFRPLADRLGEVLRNKGHNVRVAYDGAEALRVAKEFSPHALISDVHMPGLSGFELAQAFAQRFPKCGVLLITMDSTLLTWQYQERTYKIMHKCGTLEELFEFLATCEAGE